MTPPQEERGGSCEEAGLGRGGRTAGASLALTRGCELLARAPPGGARISAARPTPLAGNRALAHPPRGGREGTRRVGALLLLEERL